MPNVRPPTRERWQVIEEILDAALELPPEQRGAFLESSCNGDAELRTELEGLLRACDSATHFLEKPPVALARLAARLAATDGDGAPPDSLQPGTRVGAYRIVGEAGRGGMGVVYIAERDDGEFQKRVALKLVARGAVTRDVAVRRFRAERQILASLEHPGIARLLDGGATEDGVPYFVMEYVEGTPIDQYCDEHGLSIAVRLELFARVCDAVAYAHESRIIHRDIKPSNVLVSERGDVRLLDFGIAKLVDPDDSTGSAAVSTADTQGGSRLMTPDYASPEQLRGDPASTASDIYALGVLLYELLCGRHPHRRPGDSWHTVEQRILHEHAERPSDAVLRTAEPTRARARGCVTTEHGSTLRQTTPAGLRRELLGNLDAIVLTALRKEPSARYASVGELAADVRRHLAGSVVRARPADVGERVRVVARHPAVAVGVGAIALAIAVGAVVRLRTADPDATSAAGAIAILPFAPTANDPALERLGRDLVGTLSASLDGIGDIRTTGAHAILARPDHARASTVAQLSSLARELNASVVITGTLTVVAERVRVDAKILSADPVTPPRSVSLGPFPADLAVLTDSLTFALVRQLWLTRGAPTPSPAAVTTRSLAALRTYLEGERLAAQFSLRAAADAFARSIAADSTFWYAYWRYAWTRRLAALRVDNAITSAYLAHSAEFPEPDRLLVEAERAGTLTDRLEQLAQLTERFPRYWPGWFALGELAVREGPFASRTLASAALPLINTVSLHPTFIPAWDRLLWIAIAEGDTTASARVIDRLRRLRYDSIAVADDRFDIMQLYRMLHEAARNGGRSPPALVDSLAAAAAVVGQSNRNPSSPFGLPEKFQGGIIRYGFHATRIAMSERVIRIRQSSGPPDWTFEWHVIATASAGRGHWDRALATLDTAVRLDSRPVVALDAYRLAALGTWLGGVEPAAAALRRHRVVQSIDRLAPADRAELAWVDGLFAATQRDTAALARAIATLRSINAKHVSLLDSSLSALRLDIAGDRRQAQALLMALERDRFFLDNDHPYLTGVDRLTAARWLVAAGDTKGAADLLTWHEAVLYPAPQSSHANALLAAFAYLERARILEARGQHSTARASYEQFLRRYDAPVPAHRALVDEARAAIARLRHGTRLEAAGALDRAAR